VSAFSISTHFLNPSSLLVMYQFLFAADKKTRYILAGAVCIFLAWGLLLRFFELDHQSYWMDESFSIALADSIAHHGYPAPAGDTGSFLLNLKDSLGLRGFLYHYLLAAATLLFGKGEYVTRGLSAFLGVLGVGLFGRISYVWFDRRTSLLTMLFTTINYWQIAWSRQARDYMLLTCLFWLSLFCIERAVTLREKRFFLIAVCTALLTMAVNPLSLLLIPAALILLLIEQNVRSRARFFFAFLVATIILSAAFLFTFLVKKYFGSGPSYLDHYTTFLLQKYWPILLSAPLVFLPDKEIKRKNQILIWLFLVFSLGLFVISNGIILLAYRYIFFLTPILLIFAAQGISRLCQMNMLVATIALIALLTTQVLLDQAVILPKAHYALESDAKNSPFLYKCYTPQPRFKDAYTYINRLEHINLITPYPSISRLYRKDNDILAIPIRIKNYPRMPDRQRERYTSIPYITFPAFTFLRKSSYEVYFLLDFFAQTRMDPLLYRLIKDNCTVIKVWKQPEWSDLTLYKLDHRQD